MHLISKKSNRCKKNDVYYFLCAYLTILYGYLQGYVCFHDDAVPEGGIVPNLISNVANPIISSLLL